MVELAATLIVLFFVWKTLKLAFWTGVVTCATVADEIVKEQNRHTIHQVTAPKPVVLLARREMARRQRF